MEEKSTWDTTTQQYHGGQEWLSMENFVEDFSVTTNALGTPIDPLIAAKAALDHCCHYPQANQEPAKTDLANFLALNTNNSKNIHQRLLLGNGASELIDLVTRVAPKGAWRPGPSNVQYMEYERSAASNERDILDSHSSKEKSAITCIVNPCNPTGDYMNIEELTRYIEETCEDGQVIIVDESMQPWVGPEFRADSLISKGDWIENLFETRKIEVYLMHSWTKIWSCTGLRLGSVVCPTKAHCLKIKKLQVPWSVNVSALGFLSVATSPSQLPYLTKTWEKTPIWRAYLVDKIKSIFPQATIHGKEFLSWVWVDLHDPVLARQAVLLARKNGVPVRPGVNGYECDTYVRLAVRETDKVDVVIEAWKELK